MLDDKITLTKNKKAAEKNTGTNRCRLSPSLPFRQSPKQIITKLFQ